MEHFPETQESITFPGIEELQSPIEDILIQLREHIDHGMYDVIIGDDASGRIPALIFGEVIGGIYKQKGYSPICIRFSAGAGSGRWSEYQRGSEKERKLADYYRDFYQAHTDQGSEKKRTLIVTELVHSGSSLLPLARALKSLGIAFDIAAVGVSGLASSAPLRELRQEELGGWIYFGQMEQPSIYMQHNFSGVIKNQDDVFSEPLKGAITEPVPGEVEGVMEDIKSARSDVHIIAQRILKRYAH